MSFYLQADTGEGEKNGTAKENGEKKFMQVPDANISQAVSKEMTLLSQKGLCHYDYKPLVLAMLWINFRNDIF